MMYDLCVGFIYGLGGAAGASVAMLAFVVLVRNKNVKTSVKVAELSLKALVCRNELTTEQLRLLERIASAVEGLERLSNK